MRCLRDELQSVWHGELHCQGVGGSPWPLHARFAWCGFCAQKLKYILLTPSYNMTMQNGHDVNVHTLHPTDNGIRHSKLIEVHPSNISWHLLIAEIFNSSISAGTYHGQRVATSVFCGANQLESQIGPWGRYATLLKRSIWYIVKNIWTVLWVNMVCRF